MNRNGKSRRTILPGTDGEADVAMERVGKKNAGRELDGRTWDEVPSVGLPAPTGTLDPGDDHQPELLRSVDCASSPAKPRVTNAERKNPKETAMEKPARKHRNKGKRITLETPHRQKAEFSIDAEIAGLTPSHSLEERAQLERSILAEGCREPLTVAVVAGRKLLADGHNRYDICRRHGLSYKVKIIQLPDRAALIRWVMENQLGRRNLTPEAQSYLRGRLYNSMKHQGSRSDLTSGQSAQKSTTAQQLAEQYKVDEKTIRREGHFAEQIDALADAVGEEIKDEVLTRGARISRTDVPRLLQLDDRKRNQIVAKVRGGAKASALLRELGRTANEQGDPKRKEAANAPQGADRVRHNEAAPMTGGVAPSSGSGNSPVTSSGASCSSPAGTRTSDVPGDMSAALEDIEIASGFLRDLPLGSGSPEILDRLAAETQVLQREIERHRAARQRQNEARVDVLAAVQPVFELEREGLLNVPMTALDALFTDPSDGQAFGKLLAEAQEMIARRAARASRSSKSKRSAKPTNDALAQDDGMLLSFKMFSAIQRYVGRYKPAMEHLYNLCMETRAENPEHARICEKIDRFIENHGCEVVEDSFSYAHYLKMWCADPQAFREATQVMKQEMVGYLRALNQFSDKVLECMRQPGRASSPPPPMAAPLAPSIHHGLPTGTPEEEVHAPQPILQGTASAPAPPEKPHESPTPEEVEREVTEIVDAIRSGQMRPFRGEQAIWKKDWPPHVRSEALKLFFAMQRNPSASTQAAPPPHPITSVPAAPPVGAMPSMPGAGSAPPQTSPLARPLTSRGPSEFGMYDMTKAWALAQAMPPHIYAQAVKTAMAGRSMTAADREQVSRDRVV